MKKRITHAMTLVMALLAAHVSRGQVSLTGLPQTYTQNFNTLSPTATAFTDNSTLPGWYISTTTLPVSDGSANSNSCYNYGTASASDRALGALSTATSHYFGVRFKNNSGSAVTSVSLSFTGEQWRRNNTSTLDLSYQVSSTAFAGLTSGTWTPVSAATFTAPQNGTASALDGNAAANQASLSAAITVTVAAGQEIFLRWAKVGSSSPGLAVDDLSVTFSASCTAPTTQASNLLFGTPTTSTLPVSWTAGNGSRRVVLANTANSFAAPADGTDPTASSAYNTTLGGQQVVYNGTGTSTTVTGLAASTTYYFQVYEANCAGSSSLYSTATGTGNPNSATTAAPPPPCAAPNAAGAIAFGAPTSTTLPGTFAASNGGVDGYVLFVSQNGTAPALANGTAYTSANAPAGYAFVQDAATLAFTASGLTANTLYYVYAFAYKTTGCTGGPAYAAATSASATTAPPPAVGLQVTSVNTLVTVDFDNTVGGSNTGSFNGSINTTGNAGTLNSNAWVLDPNLATGAATFGGSQTGSATADPGSTTTGGFFALRVVAGNSGNVALALQPTGSAYNPGSITLRLQNQTGATVTTAGLGYVVYVVNDAGRSSTFNLQYSTDNSTYADVAALNLTSPQATTNATPQKNHRAYLLTGLSLAPNDFLYLRWTTADVAGTGSRDEIALDDITILFNPSAAATPIAGGTYQSLVVAAPATLSGPVTVAQSLSMVNGTLITTAANLLTVDAGAAVTGASDASYVSGPVAKNGSTAFTFPIGKSGQYRPVSIAGLSAADVYTAEYFQGLPPNGGTQAVGASGMNRVSFREYWNVGRSGATTCNLSLTWNGYSQVSAPSDVVVAHYNGSTWDNYGGTPTGTAGAGSVTAAGVSTFSPFTLGSTTPVNPLPLRLLSFSGKQQAGGVALDWTSTCETQMKQFVVERADGADGFRPIGTVAAKNGGCAGTARYTFDDRALSAAGSSLYRLRLVEENGRESFSNTLRFSTAGSSELRILSNPVGAGLQLAGTVAGELLRVTDAGGRVLLQWTAGADSTFDVSSLRPGSYFLQSVRNGRTSAVRFVKH